ncbi:uncharacterized protein A4U43_C05F13940 [Asparagus officinalis]|uniref:WEB family protein n=1 Tax=Asparagus officinalis TaxID=4686 RepID=A0A5P1EWW2_ASPOF|nr:WEB family protein At5g55860 [Asparagus officinalis]XP_020267990.1 WEB family protein At5g55860 [Asparagus officinalis]ONK68610.1 uncharacterized protein A4U43_C05F13940 [Asparagus officinalis]
MNVKKGRSNSFDSPKAEVGEIDTNAPFASVKAAVSLFGDVAFAGRKAKPSTPSKTSTTPEQKAFATETQLHLAQKELNKYREQLQNAETTRSQALAELDKAKKTVHNLTAKLTVINESKELALKAAEAAKTQTDQLKEVIPGEDQTGKLELERSTEQYAAAILELDAAKQDLRRIRKEFEALVEAKISACNQESEANQQSEENSLKAHQLSMEISAVQESLVHVKIATEQAQQEESKIKSEKDSTRQSYQLALEETEKKFAALQKDLNPELHKELESKLTETDTEIHAVRKQLEDARASDIESLNTVNTELDGAKEVLLKVAEEESSLRSLLESLKLELETVTKQHNELREKDAETETLVADLHVKLQECKAELDAAVAAETKATLSSGDLMTALQQLQSESETALQETEQMKKEAEAVRNEAETAKITLSEAEKKLEVALKEAEAAKAAEARALDEIKNLSARASAARSSTSAESGAAEIMISKEEYASLSQKVEESEKLTEMKVAAAVAQVEAIKASEAEAAKRLEATRKEIEEMEAAREEALKRAEMSEAAKKAVEGELRRWREKEQKKASEMAARLMAETEGGETSIDATSPPRVSRAPAGAAAAAEGSGDGSRKHHHGKLSTGVSKKFALLPNLSGMFHRKKSFVDGASPSHLPGDKERNK